MEIIYIFFVKRLKIHATQMSILDQDSDITDKAEYSLDQQLQPSASSQRVPLLGA